MLEPLTAFTEFPPAPFAPSGSFSGSGATSTPTEDVGVFADPIALSRALFTFEVTTSTILEIDRLDR